MKLGDLCGFADLPAQSGAADITGLTADSRAVQPGYLFAALNGVNMDGARFAADAVRRGAAAVLLSADAALEAALPVPVIRVANPRRSLAQLAARFYGRQPDIAAAITGTNGKTSVASFLRQIWEQLGLSAASLGTTGIYFRGEQQPLAHTTPDPVALHASLAKLADDGATHLAFEASSHGLAQYRADGIRLAAGAFTNISRDHLDYHPDFADYFAAKMRLFRELLQPGQPAIIDVDSPGGVEAAEIVRARGLSLITVGRAGETIRLSASEREGFGQRLKIAHEGQKYHLLLPLAGNFQAANALVAAGLAIATGFTADKVFAALEQLTGARGRLDLAGYAPTGAPIFIDYAHTPDALETALKALRPYAAEKLHVVFGCGGDRDRGKRPLMGEAAKNFADLVYVTDDNPRSEDPAAIRAEILAGVPGAAEIGLRTDAIIRAISSLGAGDVLLVAGKGHETGQIIGTTVIPYSDHEAVAKALAHAGEMAGQHG